jgi:hypothetical protein
LWSEVLYCKEDLYLHKICTCHSVIGLNFCCSWSIVMLHRTHSAFESAQNSLHIELEYLLFLPWNICCRTHCTLLLPHSCLFAVFIHHYLIKSIVKMNMVRIWSGYVCRLHNLTTTSPYPEDGDTMFLKTLLFTYETMQCHFPEVHSLNTHHSENLKTYICCIM